MANFPDAAYVEIAGLTGAASMLDLADQIALLCERVSQSADVE